MNIPSVIKTPKRKYPLEKVVERKYKEGVKLLGGVSYKFASENQRGVFDQITILPDGTTIFVEVKAEKGEPSFNQIQFANVCHRMNQEFCFIYGLHGKDLLLEDLKNGVPLATSYNQPHPKPTTKIGKLINGLEINTIKNFLFSDTQKYLDVP